VFVDSHCHLDFPEFAPEIDAVIARATAAGVTELVTISTKRSTLPAVVAIAERYPQIYCSVGVHPHEAEEESDVTLEELLRYAEHPKAVGIGETGLDFYYEHSPRAEQEAVFRTHIAAARETKLPLIIHTRDAEAETARIIQDEMRKGAFTGLIHCFTASAGFAAAMLEEGLYISFSGIVTFKKADALKAVVKDVPIDRLLIETDAPYLAPVPFRGKRNEPSYVVQTAREIARLKEVSEDDIGRQTTENFRRLFTRAQAPR
jgi:TatD DNase family protein